MNGRPRAMQPSAESGQDGRIGHGADDHFVVRRFSAEPSRPERGNREKAKVVAQITPAALSATARHLDADQVHALAITGIERIERDNIDVIATVRQRFRASLHAAVIDVIGVGDDQDAQCPPVVTRRSDRLRARGIQARQTAQDCPVKLFL
jgi:hypothetical protein